MVTRIRWWAAAVVTVGLMALSATAVADDDDEQLSVAILEIPDGDNDIVYEQLDGIAGLDLITHDDYVKKAEDRAFDPKDVLEDRSDLQWLMDGAGIHLIVRFEEEDEQTYRVDFITQEAAGVAYDFGIERAGDGAVRRGGAAMLQLELEEFFDERPDTIAQAASEVDLIGQPQDTESSSQEQQTEQQPQLPADPEALRRAAAEDDAALREILSRDWLWARVHGRMFQKDFSAAGNSAIYTHKSGAFPGYEVELEAFPFASMNPDMESMGFYGNFNHGLYGLTVIDETLAGAEEFDVSVNNLTVEGGAVYRLDSPLEETNRQLRFRVGAQYDRFAVSDNPEIPTTSMTSVVVGTRLVLPIIGDQFAVTGGTDVIPLAFFNAGEELFGEESYSYGFGAEVGLLVEVMDWASVSAGYTMRMMRSDFEGRGEQFGHDIHNIHFENSEVFDLNQGLRAGFVIQY